MKASLLGILGLFLSITIASAQYGGGGGYTTTGGGGGTITGGTGCNTAGSSMLKGNGSGGCANAAPGTDYAPPTAGTALLKGSGAGGFTPATSGTDYAPATGSTTSILKGNGTGAFANAVSGADYPPVPSANCGQDATHGCGYNTTTNTWSNQAITGTTTPGSTNGAIQYNNSGVLGGVPITGIVKGNGTAAPAPAAAGTDYLAPPAGTAIQKANSGGALANAVAGTDYQAALTSGAPASATIGGSGLSNPTAHSVMLGEGASPMTPLSLALDTMLIGAGAAADPVATLINGGASCGDPSHAISYSTTTHSFGCQALTIAAAPGGGPGALQYNNAGVLGGASVTGIVKGNGSLAPSAAVSGTDYAPATPTGTAILKANNAGGFSSGVAGTDYQAPIAVAAPVASNFLTGFNGVSFSGTRPLSTDLGDLPIPIPSGGTGAGTAAAALTGLGGLAVNNNLSEIAAAGITSQTAAQTNLALGPLASQPAPLDAAHGGLNTTVQPGSGQLPIGNLAGSGYTPQTVSGDFTITSAGVGTVGSTHISGAAANALAQFNGVGNIVPYTGSGSLPANQFATALSGAGALSGSQVPCSGLTGAAAHCGTNGSEINSGTVPAANGGAGTANGILKANGAGLVSAATPSVDYAPATSGGLNLPLFNNGVGGFNTGTLSGTGTNLATFSGAATAARCLHTDASGNVTITGTDCTAGTGGVPGYSNTPAVSTGGGNATVNLAAQCSLAGCTDYNQVVNGANAGTLTMTPPASTGMTKGALFWIYVTIGATAPTDIFFSNPPPSGVTYQSYVLGLLASDLTSTAAGEAAKRAAACGAPTANGVIAYQAWWDGGNLNVTNCGSSTAAPYLGVALGGTQCGPAGHMASTLPAVPSTGARCMVTDASACIAGTALNTGVTGSTPCEVVWNGSTWQPAGGAIAPVTGGFTTATNGLTSAGNTVSLITPVAAANGGAGTVSGVLKANGSGTVSAAVANADYQAPLSSNAATAHTVFTAFTAPNTFTRGQLASTDLSDLPIPASSGGSGCGQTNTLRFSGLPASPIFGTSCFILDCQTGVAGNVETGGGSIPCGVAWMGSNWVDGGLASAPAGSGTGVNIQLGNNSSGGTVLNKLASVNSSNKAIITPAGATAGIQGVCTSGCGNSGTAVIQTQGSVPIYFDGVSNPGNNITPGDYAAIDTAAGGQAGEAYDVGTTPPGGIALIGTIMFPTPGTPCSNVSCGPYNVNLFGPDVTGVAGSAAINTGVIGNTAIYGGTNTVAPMPGTFHISINGTDQIFKILTANGKCMSGTTPVACNIIVDPGVQDTETGPDLVGYMNCGSGCPPEQKLILDNSKVIFSGGSPTGSFPGPFPQDDGLVLGPNGSLQCMGNGNGTGGITDTSGAHLNSIVTTLPGIILNSWRASTNMARGEFIFDGTNVERVLSCSGSCTTGGTPPAWNGTRYGTVVDNGQVTWQDINPAGRFAATSYNADISGCYIFGNQGAQTNNDLRISGVVGALAVMRNIAGIGVGTGTGSDDQTGSDAILFDQPQQNGFCTGSGAPLACCPSSCQSGLTINNGSALTIQGLWSQPNSGISSCNPGYLVRFTGSGTGLIDVEGGQISDLGTSCPGANHLVADMSIDSNARHITFNNFYFESTSGQGHVPADQVVINGGTDINFTGVYLGGSGPGLTNSLHIANTLGTTQGIYFRGSTAQNGIVNAIKNDINGFTLAPPSGGAQPITYQYGTAAGTLGYITDGQPETFNQGIQFTKQTAPAAPGAATCQLYAVSNGGGGCDIAAKCGTSTTATTIATNVGSGC